MLLHFVASLALLCVLVPQFKCAHALSLRRQSSLKSSPRVEAKMPGWSIVSQSTYLNQSTTPIALRASIVVPPLPAVTDNNASSANPFLFHTYTAIDFLPDTLDNIATIQANLEYGAFLGSPTDTYFIRVWYYASVRQLSLVSAAAAVSPGERLRVVGRSGDARSVQLVIYSLDSGASAELRASTSAAFAASKVSVAMEQSSVQQCAQFPASGAAKWTDIELGGGRSNKWFVFEEFTPACSMKATPNAATGDTISITFDAK